MFGNLFKNNIRDEEFQDSLKKLTKKVSTLEDRIGKQELMHVEVLKKQNELFESAMNTLIKESGNFNRHALDYAAEQIEKFSEKILEPCVEEKRPWGYIEFTINGKKSSVVQPGIISYEELIELACDPLPPRKDTEFSVEFSLAGGKRQEGTLESGGKIEVVQGTIVDVMGTSNA